MIQHDGLHDDLHVATGGQSILGICGVLFESFSASTMALDRFSLQGLALRGSQHLD